MVTSHVQEALDQVRQLQHLVLERIRFHGFSGPTRICSGTLALVAAVGMSLPWYPQTARAHLLGWSVVLAVALVLNGGALGYWFLHDPEVQRNPRRLRPVLDVVPPLIVGAGLTVALVLRGHLDLLFGIWMLMFGLANLASRHVLPRAINWVGLFYIAAGLAWAMTPGLGFLQPWSLGIVFFAGEWAGGLILYWDGKRLDEAAPDFIRHSEKTYGHDT